MADHRDISFSIAKSKLTHPEFLQGLDLWLQLGLLTEWQVLEICQDHLSCDLPPWPVPIAAAEELVPVQQHLESIEQLAPVVVLSPRPRPKPRLRAVQTFISEVSVIWLLFLGVFLVVVSSGVFAASQWQYLPAIGQYGILFTYTLAFAGASWWAGRQVNLRLTAQMLQFATLLIIPVNFWMMDSLQLGRDALGIGGSLVAAVLLSIVSLRIITPIDGLLTFANSLVLSWLHWGWNFSLVPVIATYLGTLSTTFVLFWRYRQQQRSTAISSTTPARWIAVSLAINVLILIVRALWIHHVPIAQLGLAFGSCGWLLCWLNRDRSTRIVWLPGMLLLLLGWGVSIQQIPVQSFGVSILGCALLWERLKTHRRAGDLLALWLLGLQTYFLTGWIAPPQAKGFVTELLLQSFGKVGMPGAMGGLGGLWYVAITLILADWLWRVGETKLDRQAQFLTALFASCSILASAANPGIRSINLSLSTIMLLLFIWRRRTATLPLIYLLQLIAIAAIASWINVVYPQLSSVNWGWIAMTGALLEWLGSMGRRYRSWRHSAWHLGLGLATGSYLLLIEQPLGQIWWLAIPVALTLLSRQRYFCGDPTIAAVLSSIALLLQLLLLYPYHSQIMAIALGAATVVMLVNTVTLHSWEAAGLTIGLALGTELMAIYQYQPQILVFDYLVNWAAIQVWLLWLTGSWLQKNNSVRRDLYVRSTNAWATAISIAIIAVVLLQINIYIFAAPPTPAIITGVGLLTLAIGYRLRQKPQEIGWYGLASSFGCFAVLLVELAGGHWPSIAVTLLALGLMSQLAGDLWVRRSGRDYQPSWYLIPLAYGGLGLTIGHSSFTATTGFYSLVAALIGVGVGRRSRIVKPVVVISIALLSVGLYELLIFQLSQLSGGKLGDGLGALAGLAGLLAFAYRLFGRWLRKYFQLTSWEMPIVSHLHWLLGTLFGVAAPSLVLSNVPVWLMVMAGLTIYALAMGNRRWQAVDNNWLGIWTYLGICQGLGTAVYGLNELVANPAVLSLWGGSMSAAIAWRMYKIDWPRWGWSSRPWQNVAMIWPLMIVILTAQSIAEFGLVIVAAFYGWLALARQQWRISYISIGLLDWALVRFLAEQQQLTLVWISVLIGFTVLYLVQVEPLLQDMSARERRHWLRSIATGQMVVNSFYQAERFPTEISWAIISLALGLGLVLLGLRFQVRAFLYVGTLAFMLRVGRSIWLFTNVYPLTLWGVGLVLGLIMIWVAATFEARRSQINALMHHWLGELERWD